MTVQIVKNINFPKFTGARCYMMPIIQGRGETIPDEYGSYRNIVEALSVDGQDGQPGHITIDESFVKSGTSQRGYGSGERTIHTEACLSNDLLSWGPTPTWGPASAVILDRNLKVLIANSIDDTCMAWDADVWDATPDGDLSHVSDKFPRSEGKMLKAGQVAEIGIFTPHECIQQTKSSNRQFFRIVGNGVVGSSKGFTKNPLMQKH